jgi:hypothetical protein
VSGKWNVAFGSEERAKRVGSGGVGRRARPLENMEGRELLRPKSHKVRRAGEHGRARKGCLRR